MLKDDLGIFLVDIAKIYPIDNKRDYDSVIKEALDYLFDYCKGKNVDIAQAKKYVYDNYKFKTFPEPSFLKNAILENCKEIESQKEKQYRLMLLILPDGYIYEFAVDDNVSDIQIDNFRHKKIEQHGYGTQVNVYPKGSTLIGRKVFIPIDEENNRVIEIGA